MMRQAEPVSPRAFTISAARSLEPGIVKGTMPMGVNSHCGGVMGFNSASSPIAIMVAYMLWVCTVARTSGRARITAVCIGTSEEGLYGPSIHLPFKSTMAISSGFMPL